MSGYCNTEKSAQKFLILTVIVATLYIYLVNRPAILYNEVIVIGIPMRIASKDFNDPDYCTKYPEWEELKGSDLFFQRRAGYYHTANKQLQIL